MSKINYSSIKKLSVDRIIEIAVEASSTMQTKVQVAAVAVLEHSKKHGDYSKAQVLVDGLGNGVRKQALVDFFCKFGGLTISEGADGFDGWSGKEKIDIDGGKTQMWWDLKVPNPYKGFNLLDSIAKIIKGAEQAQKKTGEDAEKVDVDADTLAALKALVTPQAVEPKADPKPETAKD